METKYYTTREIADLLEVKQRRVREWIHLGTLKATRDTRNRFLIREENLFVYAYYLPIFRDLLSQKIGPRFNLYIITLHCKLAVIRMACMNPKLLEQINKIRLKKKEKEG